MNSNEMRLLLERAFYAAVAAADPGLIPPTVLPPVPRGRLLVVGAGKAAAAMAGAVERHYLERRPGAGIKGTTVKLEGLVIVPYGAGNGARPKFGGNESTGVHGTKGSDASSSGAVDRSRAGHTEGHTEGHIEIVHASHPLPDEGGVAATGRILAEVDACGADDQVIVLLSGGGSALLCSPDGLDLAEKGAVTRDLLRSGAQIDEMNAVRKHLSKVKGGRLALAAAPAKVTTLVLSDVVGDDLSSIASGPTVADPSTFSDALAVLDRYGIEAPSARRVLEEGRRLERPETPKPGDSHLDHAQAFLLGNNQGSLEAVAVLLEAAGLTPHILSSSITGEARDAGRMHAAIARQVLEQRQPFRPPCALISGGETTVSVRGRGRGGRNSEFALGLALGLPSNAPIWALVADTDGIDGSEENAGVFISPELLARFDRTVARASLDANDSYTFFETEQHLLISGPTGTNVNDLRIVLIGASEAL
ncbi:MAG: glycerate kinase [Trueperaceae bacterium]